MEALPNIILTYELGELVIGGAGEPGQKVSAEHPAIENIIPSGYQRIGIQDLGSWNVFESNYNSLPAGLIPLEIHS